MKQSSIEWLKNKLTYDNGYGCRFNSYRENVDLSEIIQQAEEMHKQEIKDAYNEGVYLAMTPSKTDDDYYKNTYEKEN